MQPQTGGGPAHWVSRLLLAGASTVVALLGLSAVKRVRSGRAAPQRVQEAPSRTFSEFERFTHELAHEIRNPLTAINARLYKLQKKLPEGSTEHRDAVIIEHEIKRLDQILENFRKLGGRAAPRIVLVSADAILRELRELFVAELERESIEFRCEPAPGIEFCADPQQLNQILVNLIKNAAESILQTGTAGEGLKPAKPGANATRGPRRGLIQVRIRQGTGRLKEGTGPAVMLEVEDDGPGIPDPIRSRLLEPFFSTKEHGTGLGLPIAARMIAQHGGALEFENEPGHTTLFRVILPEKP